MSTLRQLEANRRNALKSTGPRTPEGKAVVAGNAIQHGIFCQDLLAEGDDPLELERMVNGLLADIAPRNFSERFLAERIISATWRLRRLTQSEQHMHQRIADGERQDLGEVGKYPGEEEDQAACDKLPHRKQDKAQDCIDQRRQDWANEQLCPAGLTLALELERKDSQIERYSRYEKRLEGTLHRAWRELRLLRKEGPVQPPSPLVGEGGGEGGEVQTPEIDPSSGAKSELVPSESARLTPHPSPLPQGERGPCNAASIAIVQNKPNSAPTEESPEIYGAMRAEPVEVTLTPAPPAAPAEADGNPTG
jgi:hypothetical protein